MKNYKPDPDLLTLKNNMYLDVPESKESKTLLKNQQDKDSSKRNSRQESIGNLSMSKLNNSKNALIPPKESDNLIDKLHIKNNFNRSNKSKSIEESDKESQKNLQQAGTLKDEKKQSNNQVIELKNMDNSKIEDNQKKKNSKSFSKSFAEEDEEDKKQEDFERHNIRKLVKKEKIVSVLILYLKYLPYLFAFY